MGKSEALEWTKHSGDGQEVSLETHFEQLDQLIEALEEKTTSLEDAFQLYQKGMELIRLCSEKIEQVEEKVLVMNEDGGFDEF